MGEREVRPFEIRYVVKRLEAILDPEISEWDRVRDERTRRKIEQAKKRRGKLQQPTGIKDRRKPMGRSLDSNHVLYQRIPQ